MKTYFLKFFVLPMIIISFSFLSALCNIPSDTTICLSFGDVENPPKCLIPYKTLQRPKIGLALSGGGMRCIAQIGALEVLKENDIPIDFIVGTSMGSIIGGLYSVGYEPDQIWEIAKSINWENILFDKPQRSTQFLGEKQERDRYIIQFRLSNFGIYIPQAVTPGYQLTRILTDLTMKAPFRSLDFDKLRIPLRIIATDLLTGNKVVISHGELAQAMRASIAIPLLFTPISQNPMLLADGGILDNLPVDETRRCGADIVIAIDTTSPLRTKDQMNAPWEVADQVTSIMQQKYNQNQQSKADVLISLKKFKSTSLDFAKISELHKLGRVLTAEKIQTIKSSFKSKNYYSQPTNKTFNVSSIELTGTNNKNAVKKLDALQSNKRTIAEIEQLAESLYQLGDFSNVFVTLSSTNNNVRIKFHAKENPVLSQVTFIGNTIFSDSLLQSFFSELLNKPINYYKGKKILQTIEHLYHSKGFSLAYIDKIIYDNKTKELTIFVNEGKIQTVFIKGLSKTRKFVVKRDFLLKPGDIFNSSLLQTGIDNIYGTGLFNSVSWSNTKRGDSWDITLRLQEKLFRLLRLGSRYDLERKARAFIELADKNIFGTGNVAILHGQYGARDLRFEGIFRADRLFQTYLTTKAHFYHVRNKHFTYNNNKNIGEYYRKSTGFTISFGQQIERFGTLSIASRVEKITSEKISGSGYPTGSMNLQTIILSSTVDTRDKIPFPKFGKYHHFSYEVSSGKFLSSTISYFKVQNQLETYYTFFGNNTFRPKLFWGISDRTTPFLEYFHLGGLNSFFGFKDEELLGRYVFAASLQHRFKISTSFPTTTYISWRYDIGSIWRDNLDIKVKDFFHGVGFTLSFDTFLGPISFAYGRSSKKTSSLYFSAGFDF